MTQKNFEQEVQDELTWWSVLIEEYQIKKQSWGAAERVEWPIWRYLGMTSFKEYQLYVADPRKFAEQWVADGRNG